MSLTLETAERPVFVWSGTGGLPDDIEKGEWFTDPSGKMRRAMDNMPSGHVPWLDPVDVGAFPYPPTFAAQSVRKNPSGILPTEFKVLILPDPVEEVSKGGIIMPIEKTEKEKYATTDGTIVAISHLAFTYATDEEWGDHKPKPGDRVAFAKYAGARRKGKDGKDYILVNDKDVLATIEE